MSKEMWLPIPGYEGFYDVSNSGNVKSLARQRRNILGCTKERILRLNFDSSGYRTVKLYKDGIKKTPKVHRLVAMAFLPNPNNLPEINHIDGIKTNNELSNLEWCNRLHNITHAISTGLLNTKGENHFKAKLKEVDVRFIRRSIKNKTYTYYELAEMFGVSYSSVNHANHGLTWKNVSL